MAASKGRSTVGIISCFLEDAIFHSFLLLGSRLCSLLPWSKHKFQGDLHKPRRSGFNDLSESRH